MARYIDADAFKQKLADKDIFFPALYANELNEMPTADVAPKSEVAREIFLDIEKIINKRLRQEITEWQFIVEIAELKKKYTEEKV